MVIPSRGLVIHWTILAFRDWRSSASRRALLPNLARIPAGDFLMGAADAELDERPVHRVTVSEFFIGRFPVTNDEYAQFVRATGHPAPSIDELPLDRVRRPRRVFRDLADAVRLAGRPSARRPRQSSRRARAVRRRGGVLRVVVGGDSAATVRLPTEAEWEKAARGGAEGHAVSVGRRLRPVALQLPRRTASAKRQRGTRPTGTYPPNAFGLCDMIGNVWEWVSDWYDAEYYSSDDHRNPAGPRDGSLRIVRGGSWVNDDVAMLRCSYRHKVPPDTYAYSIGFRIACAA